MKRLIFILMVSFGIPACIPINGGGNPGPKIKAKLIRITCASIVIQIQDSNFYYLGEQWSDIFSPLTVMIDNAVRVSNLCEFPTNVINTGDIFYFQIASNPRNDCIVCAMYDAPPHKQVAVKNITQ